MNRVIKFRFWEIPSSEYHYDIDSLSKNPSVFISKIFLGEDSCIIPEQFTGIKDKNVIEIYEGDIVTIKNHNDEDYKDISLVKDKGVVYGDFGDYNSCLIEWLMDYEYYFEVIGNIHENPQLLNQ